MPATARPVRAGRIVPGDREPDRPHARRLGGDVPASGRGTSPASTTLRDHIESRLCRAPRYRQRLAGVPLGLNAPRMGGRRELRLSPTTCCTAPRRDIRELADMAFSVPLNRSGRCGSCGSPTSWPTAGSASWARPTTAWSTGSPRSSWPGCCSTPVRRRLRPSRTAGRRALARPASAHRRAAYATGWPSRRDAQGRLPGRCAGRRDAWASPRTRAARPSALADPDRAGAARAAAQRADLAAAATGAALAPARGPEAIKRRSGRRSTTPCSPCAPEACAASWWRAAPSRERLKTMVPVNVREATRPTQTWATGSRSSSSTCPATSPIRSSAWPRSTRPRGARKAAGQSARGRLASCARSAFAPRPSSSSPRTWPPASAPTT